MQLKHQQILPAPILDIFTDGLFLYALVSARSGIGLVGIDPTTLQTSFSKLLHPPPARPPFYVNNDLLWYIDNNGRIVSIDTFSGEVDSIVEPTPLLPLDFQRREDTIFMLCGIPLINGLKTATECFCLSSYDLNTKNRLMQTQSMFGLYGSFLLDNSLWVAIGKSLHRYGLDGEMLASSNLAVPSRFPLLLNSDFVISASNLGCVEVFDRNSLEPKIRFIVEKSIAPPSVQGDTLFWLTEKSACKVDLKTGSVQKQNLESPVSVSVSYSNFVLGSDQTGNVIRFDMMTGDIDTIKIHNKSLRKGIMIKNHLFLVSEQYVYSIEV